MKELRPRGMLSAESLVLKLDPDTNSNALGSRRRAVGRCIGSSLANRISVADDALGLLFVLYQSFH
jgi:hypothetical protein